MNDFISKFFGSGGTGTSLVTTGGQIGLGLVGNKTKEIEGNYAVKLAELTANANLNTQQFNIELAKLNAEKEAAMSEAGESKFNNVLSLVGVLAMIGAITAILLLKKRK
ncbi:LPXTG cell wall anchor domain-containing protein [Spirosoma pomorum]